MSTNHIITADEARALLEAATPGPWEWSVWAGRHRARLCTEEQFASGEGWLLQLDTDRVHGGTAELIAAAPDLAATVVALHAEVERAAAAERARIVAWLKERSDTAYAAGNEPRGDALLNASRVLETSEATP